MSVMTTERHAFARHLRKHGTSAEDVFWQAVRNRRLAGAKFRRQVPIASYVVDFLCVEARLAVELDGIQHAWYRDYDAGRTAALEAMGYRVLRFQNRTVLDDIDVVLHEVRSALRL